MTMIYDNILGVNLKWGVRDKTGDNSQSGTITNIILSKTQKAFPYLKHLLSTINYHV